MMTPEEMSKELVALAQESIDRSEELFRLEAELIAVREKLAQDKPLDIWVILESIAQNEYMIDSAMLEDGKILQQAADILKPVVKDGVYVGESFLCNECDCEYGDGSCSDCIEIQRAKGRYEELWETEEERHKKQLEILRIHNDEHIIQSDLEDAIKEDEDA